MTSTRAASTEHPFDRDKTDQGRFHEMQFFVGTSFQQSRSTVRDGGGLGILLLLQLRWSPLLQQGL